MQEEGPARKGTVKPPPARDRGTIGQKSHTLGTEERGREGDEHAAKRGATLFNV